METQKVRQLKEEIEELEYQLSEKKAALREENLRCLEEGTVELLNLLIGQDAQSVANIMLRIASNSGHRSNMREVWNAFGNALKATQT